MNTKTAAFAIAHPTAWDWIQANLDFPFAAAMFAAVVRYGRLTENQLNACLRCATRPAQDATAALNLSQLEQGFRAAATAAHQTEATIGGLKISFAKASSRNAGALYVKDGRTYLGKIDTSGAFTPSRDCTDAHRATLAQINASIEG